MSDGRATGTLRSGSPKGLLRAFLRAPILLYRLHLGWLLGRRFLLLTHVGRKSGLQRRTVLEVVLYDPEGGTCIVASGWGERSQWLRNIQANPHVTVTLGTRTHRAAAHRLDREEAEGALRDYSRRHPRALAKLAHMMLGEEHSGSAADTVLLAERVPLVRFRFESAA